jgi:hypothetical protein
MLWPTFTTLLTTLTCSSEEAWNTTFLGLWLVPPCFASWESSSGAPRGEIGSGLNSLDNLPHLLMVKINANNLKCIINTDLFLEQLAEIRKTSLARLFCDNSDHVDEMQHYTFKKPSNT